MILTEEQANDVGYTLKQLTFEHYSDNFNKFKLNGIFKEVSNSVALILFGYIWTDGHHCVDLSDFDSQIVAYTTEDYTVGMFIPVDKSIPIEVVFYNDVWVLYTKDINSDEWRWISINEDEEVTEDTKSTSKQVGGNHYQMAIQPIEYITKNNLGYMEGNVIKYVSRHRNKNGVEDINKAIHYLEMIKEFHYGSN